MRFEAGQYVISDLCYVLSDKNWDKLCSLMGEDFDGGTFELDSHKIYLHHTEYGDGEYFDQDGNSYGVDSGTIGIAPLSLCEKRDIDSIKRLGNVVNFEFPFDVSCRKGTFYFGNIVIPTDDQADDDWGSEEEY